MRDAVARSPKCRAFWHRAIRRRLPIRQVSYEPRMVSVPRPFGAVGACPRPLKHPTIARSHPQAPAAVTSWVTGRI
jgi:hypothetical protein